MLAAVSGNSSIFVFGMDESGSAYRMRRLLGGHTRKVKALSFCPSDAGVLVSGGIEGVYVWDVQSQQVVQVIVPRTTKAADIPTGALQVRRLPQLCMKRVHPCTLILG